MSGFISNLLRIKLSANSLSCTECAIVVAEIQQIKTPEIQPVHCACETVRGSCDKYVTVTEMAWEKFTPIKSSNDNSWTFVRTAGFVVLQ